MMMFHRIDDNRIINVDKIEDIRKREAEILIYLSSGICVRLTAEEFEAIEPIIEMFMVRSGRIQPIDDGEGKH